MRFKVGDNVKVRDGLEADKMYGEDYVIHEMVEKCGCDATVTTVSYSHYTLDVDDGEWCWTEEMVEEVGEIEEKKYIKFDIPEWVNWLARDSNGALYGYRAKPMKCSTVFGASEAYTAGAPNLQFITEDPNHYPQVKWSDEEPKSFKDGVILTSEPSELDTNEAIAALQSFGSTLTDSEKIRFGLKTVNEIREGTENQPEPDMVQNPPHYKQYSFEPIDIITEVVKEYPPEIGFHIGTTLKYLFRSPFKGKQKEDLAKSMYYLERAIKELTDE